MNGNRSTFYCDGYGDGRCHNADPGTYGHECGKPAAWIGEKIARAIPGLNLPEDYLFKSGFCDDCRHHGYEATSYSNWHRAAREG